MPSSLPEVRPAGVEDSGLLRVGWRADLAVWDVVSGPGPSGGGLPDLDPGRPLPDCAALWVGGRLAHRAASFAAG